MNTVGPEVAVSVWYETTDSGVSMDIHSHSVENK